MRTRIKFYLNIGFSSSDEESKLRFFFISLFSILTNKLFTVYLLATTVHHIYLSKVNQTREMKRNEDIKSNNKRVQKKKLNDKFTHTRRKKKQREKELLFYVLISEWSGLNFQFSPYINVRRILNNMNESWLRF